MQTQPGFNETCFKERGYRKCVGKMTRFKDLKMITPRGTFETISVAVRVKPRTNRLLYFVIMSLFQRMKA